MTAVIDLGAPTQGGALLAVGRLATELEELGVVSQSAGDEKLALLLVRGDLVVWCPYGRYFTWRSGRGCSRGRATEYAWQPAHDAVTTARLVAGRYADLVGTDPHATAIRDALSAVRREPLPVLLAHLKPELVYRTAHPLELPASALVPTEVRR